MVWDSLQECYRRNPKIIEYLSNKLQLKSLADLTRLIFLQLCQAVKYLHDHDITNRDIKVDNILCSQTSGIGDEVKLVDFTTVRYQPNDDISYFSTGTPGFRAPEHQFSTDTGYSCKAADVWAVGYSMYVFYHEVMPFYGETEF